MLSKSNTVTFTIMFCVLLNLVIKVATTTQQQIDDSGRNLALKATKYIPKPPQAGQLGATNNPEVPLHLTPKSDWNLPLCIFIISASAIVLLLIKKAAEKCVNYILEWFKKRSERN